MISVDKPLMDVFVFHEEKLSLNVYLPKIKGLKTITISENVLINNLTLSDIETETTSGDIDLNNVVSEKFVCTTISGDVNVADSKLGSFKCGSVSGDINFKPTVLGDVKVSTVSGDVNIEVLKDSGFKLTYNTVSGDFNTNLSMTTNKQDDVLTGEFGDGKSQIKVETVSRDLGIG